MTDIKPCPFCGIVPSIGSRMLTRDRKSAVDSVVHPVTDKCALDMLVFRLPEWQDRVKS